MTARKQFLGFLGWLVVAFAAAAVGAVASVRAQEFYQSLDRPAWAPPAAVFGPVWTFLYLCMAVASWLVWREPTSRHLPALVIYVTQLALNALWSWLFFAWRQGLWACIEIVVLWVLGVTPVL